MLQSVHCSGCSRLTRPHRVDAANATAARREQDARHEAASALRARDRAESDLRAATRELARAKEDLRELARAKDDAAAARAELASTRATLEAALNEARDVARTLHARLLAQQAPPPVQQQPQSWGLSAPQQPQQSYAPQGQPYGGGSFIASAAAQQAAAQGGSSLFSHSPGAVVGAHGSYQEPYFDAAGVKRPYDAIVPQQQGWGAQPVQQPPQQQAWAEWPPAEAKRMRGGY